MIRDNPDLVRESLSHRKDTAAIDEIIKLDQERREKLTQFEELRHARKGGKMAPEEGRKLRDQINELEAETNEMDEKIKELLLRVPNMPDASVPVGSSEEDNVIVRTIGEPPNSILSLSLTGNWAKNWELLILNAESSSPAAAFMFLNGLGARLQRALISFFLDTHTFQHGYKEVYLPFMVKRDTMQASGNLPKFADNLYHDAEEDYWFVPTAEVPITSLHSSEILAGG